MTTVASVYPGFLAGAVGPELRDALAIGERFFGVVVGSFFFGATLGSAVLGRVGERLGARRMIVLALSTTIISCATIVAFVRTGPLLVGALIIAGLANSASQTAANKLLGQSIESGRLGFAMAIKQSGMPGATMLGGLAVPAIALTVGWQWGYAAASAVAVVAMVVVLRFAPEQPRSMTARPPAALVSSRSTLLIAATASYFAASAAGVLGNWFTSSAVDAGWSSGRAGLVLSLGSLVAIGTRLTLGWLVDRRPWLPVRAASTVLTLGAAGALLLFPRYQWTHIIGAVLAIGVGWAWPGLFNFGIVRRNLQAASTATGITQTGVYIGVFTGPILMGSVVDRWGYEAGWIGVAVSMTIGATIMRTIAPRFAV